MASKIDQLNTPPLKLGENLYLFRHSPNNFQDELVISAHGGWKKSSGDFDNTYNKLYFYVKHGDLQNDFGIARFKGSPKIEQEITLGQKCFDYGLTKYQGSHAGSKGKPAETYESIEKDFAAIQVELDKMTKYANNPTWLAMNAGKKVNSFDVITVRNRFGAGDQMLEDVLKAVKTKHNYGKVHCFFCRGLE